MVWIILLLIGRISLKSLIDTIKWKVNQPRVDEYLHFSTDLQNPRHTCISWEHGYPMVDRPWMNTFPLLQGTAIHEFVHTIMHDAEDWNYASEQSIMVDHRDFPWTGTVDAYLDNPDGETWLIDYKTASGVSLSFMEEAKSEHVLQVSAYYHYGVAIPNLRVGILYLPSSPDYKRRWEEPRFYEIQPLSKDEVSQRMLEVEQAITNYRFNGVLPDPIMGENVWKHNKRNKNWELWYKPHYSSMFCPWRGQEVDPCGCSTLKPELMEVVEEDPNADVCA